MSMFEAKDFLNDANRYKTRALFKEICQPGDEPIFSWSRNKDNGYINIRQLFIDLTVDDPSEATFAETICSDIGWWEEVRNCYWIQSQLKEWRKVAAIKRKSKAFKSIVKEIEEGGRSSFTAAKYLIEEPWVDKRTKQAREDSKETTKEAFDQVSKDVERLKQSGFFNG
mgnify:CR=1 FL=1